MKILDEIKQDLQSIKAFMAKFKPNSKPRNDDAPNGDGECDECGGSGECSACDGTGKMSASSSAKPHKCSHEAQLNESRQLLQNSADHLQKAQMNLETSADQVKGLEKERDDAIARLDQFLGAVKIDASKSTNLRSKIEAALGSVSSTLAKQGIDMSQIPAGTVDAGGGNKTKREQYSELVAKDPRAASKFYAENCEAILSGK